ncbi:MAG TPA: glycoside hydrolase family 30 beta sandwich domain-containing protein [Polyangiaceae bacterium]|nr:glycoside hydrolase family 30 beta sandwich domain-containing protein [Polyangiaceae bacterium]
MMERPQCLADASVSATRSQSRTARRVALRHGPLLALVCSVASWSCSSDDVSPGATPPVYTPPNTSPDAPPDTAPNGPQGNAGSGGGTDVPPGNEGNVIPSRPIATDSDAGVTNPSGDADSGGAGSVDPEPPVVCDILPNNGSLTDGDANIDLASELQRISGFGGMDGGFYPELTAAQVDTAFGNGQGQMGLSIIRIRVPEARDRFGTSLAAASRASALGATVMATPWTPPANLKSNNSTVGGSLNVASYGAYADHLLAFRDFMQQNGVPLYAISVQNEPDIRVDYESCDWTANQLIDWITAHGSKFGDTRLMAPESFNFNRQVSDPILNNPAASAQVDIVAGHIYGNGLADYPLARQQGKEVWMTEHYTDSANPANQWPLALDVGTEIHNIMSANFSAYVWWAIRRAYGLMTEDGVVSKRGYLVAQYSKFIRPGFVRVRTTQPNNQNVGVTAYKGENDEVVVVALNRSAQPQTINLDVFNSCATTFSRFTTSQTKNVNADGQVTLTERRASVTLDGQSVTTFVSQ